MASVACCPKCRHELLIPDGVDTNAWAQCYACQVLFQVCDAAPREVAAAVMLDAPVKLPPTTSPPSPPPTATEFDPTATIALTSEQTIGEIPLELELPKLTEVAAEQSAASLVGANTFAASKTPSAMTIPDLDLRSAASIFVSAEKSLPQLPAEQVAPIPKVDLHSTVIEPFPSLPAESDSEISRTPYPGLGDTVADSQELVPLADHDEVAEVEPALPPVDSPPPPAPPEVNATMEFGEGTVAEGAEIDLEFRDPEMPAAPERLPTWDDSEHMDRLLGSGNEPPAEASMAGDDDGRLTLPEQVATETAAPAVDDLAAMLSTPPGGRRRRKRSAVRILVGIVVSGFIGLVIGYYVLLTLQGPEGDLFKIAQYLPGSILPDSFSNAVPAALADTRSPASDVDTGVEQAGFEETADSQAGAVEPARYSDNASPLPDDTAPKLAGVPKLTTADLQIALRDAAQAQSGLTAGDLSDAAVRRAKGDSFETLCRLAQVATWVQASPDAAAAASLEAETARLFGETLAEPHIRGEVARIVPVWMASPHRTNQGVFLAGALERQSSAGPVAEYRIDTGVTYEQPLTLLVADTLVDASHSGRPVGIVGMIVDQPAAHISGYTGNAPQAIWVSHLVPLD